MKKYNILQLIGFTFALLFVSLVGRAQHNTSSPYSMYGLGEIENRSYGITSGMGNTGIGMRMPNTLNTANPAAISTIDTLRFVLDVGLSGRASYFKQGSLSDNSLGLNVNKFSFGFRAMPKWMMSLGIRSFTNVGYKLQTSSPIEGSSDTYITNFDGSGGINRLYFTNAYNLTSKFSLGVTTSYLFGSIDRTEATSQYEIKTSSFSKKIYFEFGAQYTDLIAEKYQFTAGITYGYKAKIKSSNTRIISDVSSILSDRVTAATYNYIPQYIGGGLSVATTTAKNRMWIIAADYMFQNWSSANSNNPERFKYLNSHRINAGIQYIPNARMPRNYVQNMRYQLGGVYNASNLQIGGVRMQEYGVTAGLGFPLRSGSYINFSAEAGYRGGKKLIKEKYILFTLGASISEIWFVKRLYN